MKMLSHCIAAPALQSEIGRGDRGAVEILGRRGQREPAFLEAIEARRGVERAVDVLLDEHDRRALGGDGRRGSRRCRGSRPAPARATAHRTAAAADWTSARGRPPPSAAARPTAPAPAGGAARAAAETARRRA